MFPQALLFALKWIPMQNIKNANSVSLHFSKHYLTKFDPNITPKTPLTLHFMLIYNEIFQGIQLIICVAIQHSLPKKLKKLKNLPFCTNLQKKGISMPWATSNKKKISEITKTADHKLSKLFYFIKISNILTEFIFFHCPYFKKR